MIPDSIIANTSQEWEFSLSEYPPSSGYTAEVTLRNGGTQYTVTATDDGASTYTATQTATQTAAWTAGQYDVFVFAVSGDDRHLALTGQMCVVPDPSSDNAGSTITQFETDLAAVDTAIRAIITGGGVKSYSVQTVAGGARQLERMTLDELRSHRRWLQEMVDAERRKCGKSRTGGYRRVLVKLQ